MRKLLLSSASALVLALALPALAQDSGSSGNDTGTQSSQSGQTGQTGGSSTGQPMPDDGSTGTAESGQTEQPTTGTAQTDEPPATGSETAATTPDDSDAGADEMGGPMGSYSGEGESFQGTIAGGYAAEDLIGKSVVTAEGDDVATVEDLLIGSDDSVQHVLVDVGGFLGLGGKTVALDIEELQPAQGSGEELVTNMTEDEIRALPALEEQDGQWVMAEENAQ